MCAGVCLKQSGKFGKRKGGGDRQSGRRELPLCTFPSFTRGAEGAGGTRPPVTLDKDEMRGYDWLFSDFTDCESFQLETMTRCSVTAVSPFPTSGLLCLLTMLCSPLPSLI